MAFIQGRMELSLIQMEIFVMDQVLFLRQLCIAGKFKIIRKKHWNIDFLIKRIYLIILTNTINGRLLIG